MRLGALMPICACGNENEEHVYKLCRGVFVSAGSANQYIKRLRRSGKSDASFQHWKVSTKYNSHVQLHNHKIREWYLGMPRMIYPSLVRLRSFLNAIPQDCFVPSGDSCVLIEVDTTLEYIQSDILFLIMSMLTHRLQSIQGSSEVHSEALDFLRKRRPSRCLERYIRDAKQFMVDRPSNMSSHIVLRSLMYNQGLDEVLMDPSRPSPQMRVLVTVCNSRIGQFDQTYFSVLSPNGGIIPINQSINAQDEVIFSLYVASELVSRFQTVGLALMHGPLRLSSADLGETGLYVYAPDCFFVELFSECLQWTGGTTSDNTSEPAAATGADTQRVGDISPRINLSHRLHPSSGIELSKEEKFVIVMSALPSYPYRQMEQFQGESEEDFILRTQCQICLEDYHESEPVRVLPCMHVFHGTCAEEWLQVRLQCPNCCADIVDILANEGGGSPQIVQQT